MVAGSQRHGFRMKFTRITQERKQYLPTSMLKCIPNTASQLRTNTSTQNKHCKKRKKKKKKEKDKCAKKWVGQYRVARTRRIP